MADKTEFIACEWKAINEILGGGLRRGTTCLIEELHGESRGVSGLLGISFLRSGLKQDEAAIILLSEHTVDEYQLLPPVQSLLKEKKAGQLLFMDGLSSLSYGEPRASTPEGVVRCTNVRYAAKFYEELRTTVNRFELVRCYIDSLSVLLHAMESDRAAWQFWLALLPLIRRQKLTVITSFYPEMHTQQFAESIERLSDCILRFKAVPSALGEKPIRQIQAVKNRGLTYDDKIHSYERKGFEYYIND